MEGSKYYEQIANVDWLPRTTKGDFGVMERPPFIQPEDVNKRQGFGVNTQIVDGEDFFKAFRPVKTINPEL